MATQSTHVRHGIGSVRPYLYGPLELLDFVTQTFEAVEIERHEFGPRSFHVEVQIGDSVIALEAGELPSDVSSWTNSIYVYVTDVDAVYGRALMLGAKPLAPLEDKPYNERRAGFKDAAGNTWWIATYAQPMP